MAHLYGLGCGDGVSEYVQTRRHKYDEEGWEKLCSNIRSSTTLYVGNLSFYTREEQIYEFFGTVAPVRRVVMGLNRETRNPCGFCFVMFYEREDAIAAVNYLNGMMLDERAIKVDIDEGFTEDRQYGRGRSGGQVRDELRQNFDFGRGGWGTRVEQEQQEQQERQERARKRREERQKQAPTSMGAQGIDAEDTQMQDSAETSNPRFRDGADSDEDE